MNPLCQNYSLTIKQILKFQNGKYVHDWEFDDLLLLAKQLKSYFSINKFFHTITSTKIYREKIQGNIATFLRTRNSNKTYAVKHSSNVVIHVKQLTKQEKMPIKLGFRLTLATIPPRFLTVITSISSVLIPFPIFFLFVQMFVNFEENRKIFQDKNQRQFLVSVARKPKIPFLTMQMPTFSGETY